MEKHNGRLTSVIDCGTVNGERKVMLSFQLADIDVEPKDKTLPIYKQFAKTPYGGVMSLDSSTFNDICTGLGCDKSLEGITSCVGMNVVADVEVSQYQGKNMYNVILVYKHGGDMGVIDWGVDTKSFILTNDTTLDEINALGFDSKHVKNSDEYNRIMDKYRENESVIF